jgi:DNA-directed RNA polymerase subunit RPC12/RpoP
MSLEPLGELSDLQQLVISNRFPVEEFARLSARLPDTECDAFIPHSEPLADMGSSFKCKKCGVEHLVLLTGKASKRYLCPACDAKRLATHVAEFEAAAAAVRNAS